MQSVRPLIRGSMASLSTLALSCAVVAALAAALVPANAAAQPQRPDGGGWNAPRAGGWPPTGAHLRGGPSPAVPRGDLRADIADNARQRPPPPRPEPPAPPRH